MQVFLSCISEIKASTCPQAPRPPCYIYGKVFLKVKVTVSDCQNFFSTVKAMTSGTSMQNFRSRYPNTTKISASNILFLRPICWEKRDALLRSKHHLLALEIPKDVVVDSLLT